ncbi:MAG TPA: SpoIIE family protein phosphatase [Gemmataceae bacterium]|jgi:serine phosphatase RsbU (regulator of sigma subunit)|nr:SpoIIE family protein phosphatase [Gemmataceae bacterium]
MPSLILTKTPDGSATGERHPLGNEPLIIGRSPEKCRVVLPANAVSREHARIIPANGQYFIEDLQSRNKTFLNNKQVDGRWPNPLKNGDNIKICDFLFNYQDANGKPPPPVEEEEETSNTTVEAKFDRASPKDFLTVQPQEKLRALLDITTALSKTLHLEALLPQIADELFKVFKQADRCFIIQLDEDNRLRPVVTKVRRQAAGNERFSRTIVRRCLETLTSYLSEDATSDSDVSAAQSIAEFKIRSVMCVPLASQDGKPLGVIQLDSQDRTKKFSQDDLKFLICVAGQASVALENARMHETILSNQKLEEENRAATKVQRGFLPQSFPLLPGYEFFAHYTAARTVGGDYYDFIPLADGKLAVLLGDVSGKGVPAALLMARLSGEARVSMLTQKDVAAAITHLNEQLMQANLEDRYVTLSAAVIDPKAHRIQVVSAGHLSPFVYRRADKKLEKVFEKDTGDFPVGWVPGHVYSAFSVDLGPGDSVMVYTDGIEDAQPASGQRFTEDGVVRTVKTVSETVEQVTARELGAQLVHAVQTHAGSHPQFDDIALVCFGRVLAGESQLSTDQRPTRVG